MGRRGPEPKYVKGPDGNPVVGLRIQIVKKGTPEQYERYYVLDQKGKRKYFPPRDRTEAVREFRLWEVRQRRKHVPIRYDHDPQTDPALPHANDLAEILQFELDGFEDGPLDEVHKGLLRSQLAQPRFIEQRLPEEVFWAKCRELIVQNPTVAAQKLGLPQIACLDELEPPEPLVSCKEVLDRYLAKRKKITKREGQKVARAWDSFVSVTQANTLAEITEKEVAAWEDAIFTPLDRGDIGAKTARHRIQRVVTVLEYARTKRVNLRHAERVLSLIRSVDRPTALAVDPRPVSRADFEKLYRAADVKWRCILLVSLNCAYYPKDIRELPLDAIDFRDNHIRFRRKKTGIARVAILWPETVQAIQDYRAIRPTCEGPLIINATGTGYSEDGFRHAFDRLKKDAGLNVTFDQIRDGAYTNACQTGVDERDAKILAGHRSGLSDNYVMRNPQRTQPAVDAIREHYRIADLAKDR